MSVLNCTVLFVSIADVVPAVTEAKPAVEQMSSTTDERTNCVVDMFKNLVQQVC